MDAPQLKKVWLKKTFDEQIFLDLFYQSKVIWVFFIERQIDQFEADRSAGGNQTSAKPMKEFSRVQLFDLRDEDTGALHVYLIAGKKDVFLLGGNSEEWAQRLSEEEIRQLPVDIYWTGGINHFEVDSRKTTELRKYGFNFIFVSKFPNFGKGGGVSIYLSISVLICLTRLKSKGFSLEILILQIYVAWTNVVVTVVICCICLKFDPIRASNS